MDEESARKATYEIRREVEVLNRQFDRRFHFFFVGLVFALLSLAIEHPIETNILPVIYLEFMGWILLLVTGGLALYELGAFVDRRKQEIRAPWPGSSAGGKYTFTEGLPRRLYRAMWFVFMLALLTIISSRIWARLVLV